MSIVPINVTKSDKNKFLLKCFSKYKWFNDGDLILHLNGLLVLSVKRETPNSPFGDSTGW